ncbi:hypothetical protein [Kocuria sp. CH-021]|uniref:hypothetical protein n=1 Tax=Kocuria sp. CH-021 TaxID=3406735 RepID=UPI003C75501E
MNLCELRTSILESLGVTITEVPHEEIDEDSTSKIVSIAPRELLPTLTDWLDATHTGWLVEITFTEGKCES